MLLFENIKSQLNSIIDDSTNVVINCGHFLIFSEPGNPDNVIPTIVGEDNKLSINAYIIRDFGFFSNETFEMGLHLYKHLQSIGKFCFLTLLINDWQRIKKDSTRERAAPNKYRKKFYSTFSQPPSEYLKSIKRNGLENVNWIGDNKQDSFFFRETRLRDRFKRKLKKSVTGQFISLDRQLCLASCAEFEENININSYYYISNEGEMIKVAEYGKVGCAGEIAQLIAEINTKMNNTVLINILPLSCSDAINLGTKIAFETEQELDVKVVNIFPINNDNPWHQLKVHTYGFEEQNT